MLLNGNEVWAGTDNGVVYQYDRSGNYLSDFSLSNSGLVGSLLLNGQEVWAGTANNEIHRYDLDGNFISLFQVNSPTSTPVASMALIPEPGTGVLMGLGLTGLSWKGRRSLRS